jgi:hypothetical protein
MVTEPVNYIQTANPSPHQGEGRDEGLKVVLPRAAAPGAEALDLASFRRRYVVRAASHLAHEPLLLHLAAELPKRLLELLGVFDDYSHDLERIPVDGRRRFVKNRWGLATWTRRSCESPPQRWSPLLEHRSGASCDSSSMDSLHST